MYCYKCGNQVPADAGFCSTCGIKQVSLGDALQRQPQQRVDSDVKNISPATSTDLGIQLNSLKRSIILLWSAFGIALIGDLMFWQSLWDWDAKVVGAFQITWRFSLYVLITIKINQYKNWARILGLCVVVLGSISVLFNIDKYLAIPYQAFLAFGVIGLQFWAMYILFFGIASKLFRTTS